MSTPQKAQIKPTIAEVADVIDECLRFKRHVINKFRDTNRLQFHCAANVIDNVINQQMRLLSSFRKRRRPVVPKSAAQHGLRVNEKDDIEPQLYSPTKDQQGADNVDKMDSTTQQGAKNSEPIDVAFTSDDRDSPEQPDETVAEANDDQS